MVNVSSMKFTSNLGLARNPSGRYELVINITQIYIHHPFVQQSAAWLGYEERKLQAEFLPDE